MAEPKRPKYQNLPFIIDDVVRIEKCVTKQTTCSGVIAKLPTLPSPLAVFISIDGEMKELPAKTKLLKAWRSAGPAKNVEFVIKKSENPTKRAKGGARKLLGERKTRDKQGATKSPQLHKKLSRTTLKQVSDLAVYVRYQEAKVNKLLRQSKTKEPNHSTPQGKLMKRMTSRASISSMDRFLEKADLDAMAGFLSFCGQVTKAKLRGKPEKTADETNTTVVCNARDDSSNVSHNMTSRRKTMDRSDIYGELKSTKLGLKNKFRPQPNDEKRTSAVTIGSTDTGYQSVESVSSSGNHTGSQSTNINRSSYSQNLVADDQFEFQRHSTPLDYRRRKLSTDDTLDTTITQEKVNALNDTYTQEGKSLIFEKFMTNHTHVASVEPTGSNDPTPACWVTKRRRVESEDGEFRSMEDKCRFLWNKYCDSDTDTDSEADDNLDKAFIKYEQPRKLRRESGISNLKALQVRHSLPASRVTPALRRESGISNPNALEVRHSLPASHVTPAYDVTGDFNYSFDCSFPRFQDESQSVDFTVDYSFSDSELSSYHGNECRAADDSLDSFMNTFIEDSIHNTAFECSWIKAE